MRQTGKKREMFTIIQLICATFSFLYNNAFMHIFPKYFGCENVRNVKLQITINNELEFSVLLQRAMYTFVSPACRS